MTKKELEERLIQFAARIIRFCQKIPNSREGNYFAGQMIRLGSSPALNYGEAMDAESTNDLIHKNKIILKELRETHIALRICIRIGISTEREENELLIDENNELISIFVASIKKLRLSTEK